MPQIKRNLGKQVFFGGSVCVWLLARLGFLLVVAMADAGISSSARCVAPFACVDPQENLPFAEAKSLLGLGTVLEREGQSPMP